VGNESGVSWFSPSEIMGNLRCEEVALIPLVDPEWLRHLEKLDVARRRAREWKRC